MRGMKFALCVAFAGLPTFVVSQEGEPPYSEGDTLTPALQARTYSDCNGDTTTCVYYIGPGASLTAPFSFADLHVDNRECPTVTVVASYNLRCQAGMYQAENLAELSVSYGDSLQVVASAQNTLQSYFTNRYDNVQNDRVLHIADYSGDIMSTHPEGPDTSLFDQFPAYIVLDHNLMVTHLINAGDELPSLDDFADLRNDDLSSVADAVDATLATLPSTTPSLISIAAVHSGVTRSSGNTFTVTFSRPVIMDLNALTLDAGTTGATVTATSAVSPLPSGGAASYEVMIEEATVDGTYTLSLDVSTVTNLCTGVNELSVDDGTATTLSVIIGDATEATITSANAESSNQETNTLTIAFDGDVPDFSTINIDLDPGTTGAVLTSVAPSSSSSSSSSSSYTATIASIISSGTYTITIITGWSNNIPVSSVTATYHADLDAPSATATSTFSSPTTSSTNTVVFTFSDPLVAVAGLGNVAAAALTDFGSGASISSITASTSTVGGEDRTTSIAVGVQLAVNEVGVAPGAYLVQLQSVFADPAGNIVGPAEMMIRTSIVPTCTYDNSCCAAAFGVVTDATLVVEIGPDDVAWPADNTNNDKALHHARDVAYNPAHHQLFVANTYTDDVTVIDLDNVDNAPATDHMRRVRDRASYHYMANISSLSFDQDGFFAVCNENPNNYNGQMDPNYFMGPTLYNGSMAYPNIVDHLSQECDSNSDYCYWVHADMLHEAPMCMGIEHDSVAGGGGFGHVYWAFDGWNGMLVRFDFRSPHGPFDMDHAEAFVRRYPEVQLTRVEGVPGHMAFHHDSRQLFISDPGGRRVLQLDTTVGDAARDACLEYPIYSSRLPNFEYSIYECASYLTFIDLHALGLGMPSGIAHNENVLYVGDHEMGHIHAFDMESAALLASIDTGSPNALYGLEVVEGVLYYVNGTHLVRVEAGMQCPSTDLDYAYPPVAPEVDDSCAITDTEQDLAEECNIQIHPAMEMPGYGNTEFTDLYGQSTNCSELNFDALLLTGYYCHPCLPLDPCYNGGTCAMEWVLPVHLGDSGPTSATGFTCDCTGTGHSGTHCQVPELVDACDENVRTISARILSLAGMSDIVSAVPLEDLCIV